MLGKKYMVTVPGFDTLKMTPTGIVFKMQDYLNMMYDEGLELFKIVGEYYIFKKREE